MGFVDMYGESILMGLIMLGFSLCVMTGRKEAESKHGRQAFIYRRRAKKPFGCC